MEGKIFRERRKLVAFISTGRKKMQIAINVHRRVQFAPAFFCKNANSLAKAGKVRMAFKKLNSHHYRAWKIKSRAKLKRTRPA